MSFEVTNFEQQVIERSKEVPVLVDFWAPWCGPCQVLGPTIEKLAGSANGRWELVKVNVDQHQQLSNQYKVRGIPAVKLFVDGEVMDEFTGALPESQIQQWLAEKLPTPTDKQVMQAIALFEVGDTSQAQSVFEAVLQTEPEHPKASFYLAKMRLFSDADQALQLLKVAEKSPQLVNPTLGLVSLVEILAIDSANLEPHSVKDTFVSALEALKQQNFDRALEQFIQVVMAHKAYQDEAARKACIAIFNYLGAQHETTKKYRRRFDMALY